MYCKCGNEIPEVRVKLGYKTCVECSKEDKWGCSHLIFHKTGNTIEIIKDKELCEQINMMAERPAFGVSRGVKGNIRKPHAPKNPSPRKIRKEEPKLSLEEVGKQAMHLNDKKGPNSATIFLDECLKKKFISNYQYKRIQEIIFAINNNNYGND